MLALVTERLILSEYSVEDTGFIIELLNDPDFIRFIGDRNVHTVDDAVAYITNGPQKSYAVNGFGLWKVSTKTDPTTAIGMCGLIKRDYLPDIDVGYAFLPKYRGHGYAFESASACLNYAKSELKALRLCGITDPENARSVKLLEALGMVKTGSVRVPGTDHDISVYLVDLGAR